MSSKEQRKKSTASEKNAEKILEKKTKKVVAKQLKQKISKKSNQNLNELVSRDSGLINDDIYNSNSANALIVGQKIDKRKNKVQQVKTRELTKKEKKALEKKLDEKKKKQERQQLYDVLEEKKLDAEELKKLKSFSQVGQKQKSKKRDRQELYVEGMIDDLYGHQDEEERFEKNKKTKETTEKNQKLEKIEGNETENENPATSSDSNDSNEDEDEIMFEKTEKMQNLDTENKPKVLPANEVSNTKPIFVDFGFGTNPSPQNSTNVEKTEENPEKEEENPEKEEEEIDPVYLEIAERMRNEYLSKLAKGTLGKDESSSSSEEETEEGQQNSEDGEPAKKKRKKSHHEQPKDEFLEYVKGVYKETEGKAPVIVTRKGFQVLNRTQEIEDQRSELPIIRQEDEIIEAVLQNDFVIICGSTGTGKTTQIPQFLYEYGFGNRLEDENADESASLFSGIIAVTQPRRVAAISTSKRVAEEMNVKFGETVCYQVRYSNNLPADHPERVKVKFMTDGVLLKEIQLDPLLLQYSVIILDEAHERNINTDILIGWLSRFLVQRNKMWKEGKTAPVARKVKNPETGKEELVTKWIKVKPLKLLIMSATLRVTDFTENKSLFPNPESQPKVVEVKSRQFPVTVYFNRKTCLTDYVKESVKKIQKIHENLPFGGILVFLTGRTEIRQAAKMLNRYEKDLKRKIEMEEKKKLEAKAKKAKNGTEKEEEEKLIDEEEAIDKLENLESESEKEDDYEENDEKYDEDDESEIDEKELDGEEDLNNILGEGNPKRKTKDLKQEIENARIRNFEKENKKDLVTKRVIFNEEQENEEPESKNIKTAKKSLFSSEKLKKLKIKVLQLYAQLPPEQQFRVFEKVDQKTERIIILATNVAETSLTIPGIRYVVDCGREKDKIWTDPTSTGTQGTPGGRMAQYVVKWITRSSAEQRAGRAGRVGPGVCYHLFSSAVFENTFDQFPAPDILKTPIDSVALTMKVMGVNKILNFPLPTKPNPEALNRAIKHLQAIAALTADQEEPRITEIGKEISEFPLAPHLGKMLYLAQKTNILGSILAVVSALTVTQVFMPFLEDLQSEEKQLDVEEIEGSSQEGKKKEFEDEDEEVDDYGNTIHKKSGPNKSKQDEIREKRAKLKRKREKFEKIMKKFANSQSDQISELKAFAEFDKIDGFEEKKKFCEENYLNFKNLTEINNLRLQLIRILLEKDVSLKNKLLDPTTNKPKKIQTPSFEECTQIRFIICAGLIDCVARRVAPEEVDAIAQSKMKKRINDIPYFVEDFGNATNVYIHNQSFLHKVNSPQYLVFSETTKNSMGTKILMRGVTEISAAWLNKLKNNK